MQQGRVLVAAGATGVLSALWCAAVGIGEYSRGRATSYDLAIFAQAARSWASLRLPTADVLAPGRPLLGDHFSPATVVFGPAWALWPDPRVLILLQAVLLGLGAGLVARCAWRHLPPWPAAAVSLVVLVAHPTTAAAAFDVHEVAVAVPLLALTAGALLRGAHRAAAGWSLPLLAVKEDMGATVAAVALVLWLQGRRRLGAALLGLAVVGTAVAFTTMLAVDPAHDLSRLGSFTGGPREAAATGRAALEGRLLLLAGVVAGCGLLWVVSPIALLAVPTLAWRVLSSEPSYWSHEFHYGAVLVPVAGVALVDVLRRAGGSAGSGRAGAGRRVGLPLLAVGSALLTTLLVLDLRALSAPWQRGTWTPAERVRELRQATAGIPAGAVVAADNTSGAYLVARHRVRGWSDDHAPGRLPRWVVLDTARPSLSVTPAAKRRWLQRVRTLPGVAVTTVGSTAVVELAGPAGGHRPS